MKDLRDAVCQSDKFRLHPLGFFYLSGTTEQGLSRRVHVWLDGDTGRRANECHLHSYDIVSLAVAGVLRSELFLFDPTTDGTDVEFVVSYRADESISRPTGRRGILSPVGSFETATGASYWLKAGVIHRVQVKTRPCVTVLRTWERGVPIFVYGSDNEKRPFSRRLATPEEAQRISEALGKQW